MHKLESVHRLSWVLVAMFITGSVLVISGILFLGGLDLFGYLKTTLVQVIGLGIAITAGLFFVMRTVWRLEAVPMGISIIFFIIGMAMFVSVSMGRMYSLQYPVFVESFGPGQGPGLPFKNVIAFFKNIQNFEYIDDIARDPNEVPPPLNISSEDSPLEAIDSLVNDGVLQLVEEDVPPEDGSTFRTIYLETSEVLAEVAPGITFNYWTFNNKVPGPLFRAREGDIIEVTIYNRPENLHNHNVDFHAATGPGGGGAVSVVMPGETKVFRFKALNPGLFVYHCAVPNMAVHMAHGMYGLILIEPKEGLPAVDKEFYVMQGELYTTGTIGRRGLQIFDAKKMMDGDPEYITFNGRPNGLMDKMQAEVGDKVRMYVGNGGVANNSSFHVVGEIFDNVYPEASIGGTMFHNVQTTNIPAGGATIVEFTVEYPGKYVLVDHALMRTDKGAWGVLEVTGEANPEIFDGDFTNTTSHESH